MKTTNLTSTPPDGRYDENRGSHSDYDGLDNDDITYYDEIENDGQLRYLQPSIDITAIREIVKKRLSSPQNTTSIKLLYLQMIDSLCNIQ